MGLLQGGTGYIRREMVEIDEGYTEELGTLDSSEKMIDMLGGRWWRQAAEQEGDKIRINIIYHTWYTETASFAPNCCWRCLYLK